MHLEYLSVRNVLFGDVRNVMNYVM